MPRKLAKGDASQPAAGSDAVVKAEIAKGEGPMTDAEKAQPAVTLAVSKRLRAARKRLTKIEAISSAEKEGKTLNDDQVCSRHACAVSILRGPAPHASRWPFANMCMICCLDPDQNGTLFPHGSDPPVELPSRHPSRTVPCLTAPAAACILTNSL